MILSSCSSAQQLYGTTAGASLGGMFGSTLGGIMGGWRGHDAGKLAGMVIGGVVGAAATAPKTDKGNYSTSQCASNDAPAYYENSYGSPFADLTVDNIRFIDDNNSRSLEAGEHATLVFEIRNDGTEAIYDIAPVITVTGTKHINLSPTTIINELKPGAAVRYKAEVIAGKKLGNGVVDFTICLSDGRNLYMATSFQMNTYKKK